MNRVARRRTTRARRRGRLARIGQAVPATVAGNVPVRSPRVSFRDSPPSQHGRRSISRTSSACAISIPSTNSRTCIVWRRIVARGRHLSMDRSAIVTGGTGGLGVRGSQRLLEDGWRVVVPWVVERELERVQERQGLELVEADLLDQAAVENVVAAATRAGHRSWPGQPDRRVRGRRPRPRDAGRRVREAVPAQPPFDVSDDPGGGAPHDRGRRRVDRVRGNPGRAAALPGRRRLYRLESGRHRVVERGGGRVQGRRRSLQRRAAGVIDTPANRAETPNADFDKWVKPAEIAGSSPAC